MKRFRFAFWQLAALLWLFTCVFGTWAADAETCKPFAAGNYVVRHEGTDLPVCASSGNEGQISADFTGRVSLVEIDENEDRVLRDSTDIPEGVMGPYRLFTFEKGGETYTVWQE